MLLKKLLYKKILIKKIKIENNIFNFTIIKYNTMDTCNTVNKENITTIHITTEYDKICLLEQLIKYVSQDIESTAIIETIFSNLIDSITSNQENDIQQYLNLLKDRINDIKILKLSLQLSISIAKIVPLLLTLEVNQNTIKYINLIENNNKIGLPIF